MAPATKTTGTAQRGNEPRARSYESEIGRFTGEDSVKSLSHKLPNEQEVTDPLSLNLYTYAHNNPVINVDRTGNFSIGNIFNGTFMAVMGYAAITAGMAALTVATGGAALIALGTVAAGVGAMSLGASEVIGGVTGYNPMRVAMGDQTYSDSMMLASMGSMVGMQYSGQYYQMYGSARASSINNLLDFNNQQELNGHYAKHSGEFQKALGLRTYSVQRYLDDANYVARNGIFVSERNAYIKFLSGDNFAFLGLDRSTGEITTFHVKNVAELSKIAPNLIIRR